MPKLPYRDKPTGSRAHRVRPAAELLSSQKPRNDAQRAVIEGAAGLAATRSWLLESLPAELGPHVSHALERDGNLTVFTESGVWAARLKLSLAEAKPRLAPRLPEAGRITVRVIPGGKYRR